MSVQRQKVCECVHIYYSLVVHVSAWHKCNKEAENIAVVSVYYDGKSILGVQKPILSWHQILNDVASLSQSQTLRLKTVVNTVLLAAHVSWTYYDTT